MKIDFVMERSSWLELNNYGRILFDRNIKKKLKDLSHSWILDADWTFLSHGASSSSANIFNVFNVSPRGLSALS